MYVNFVNDRKQLEYECLKDTLCGHKLVLITDSSVIFVKDKSKRIVFVSIVVTTLLFINVQSAEAIDDELTSERQERLVKSILAKVPESDYREISINKFFKKILKVVDPVISDQRFWRTLVEL